MKYANQLQLLSKKFLSVQDALFAGNKAKARFARNLAMFAVIAALIATFAQVTPVIREAKLAGPMKVRSGGIIPKGETVEVLYEAEGSRNITVRCKGKVYDVPAEVITTDARLNVSQGAQAKELDWIEDYEVQPRVMENRPEELWRKFLRMGGGGTASETRITRPEFFRKKYDVLSWDMVRDYDESSLPFWMAPSYRRENKIIDPQVTDAFSLQPEFEKAQVAIKKGTWSGGMTCGIMTAQDVLELLWSQRMGFPVKADPKLIRSSWLQTAASGKFEKAHDVSKELTASAIMLLKGVAENGGYDLLSAASKARIPRTNLPRIVVRSLTVDYYLKKSASHYGKPDWGNASPRALIVDELKKGRPIIWDGAMIIPPGGDKNKIQSMDGSKNPNYPYPKTRESVSGHQQLITGYYLWEKHPNSDLFFEIRGNWGTHYGEKGYAYLPVGEANRFQPELASVSLE